MDIDTIRVIDCPFRLTNTYNFNLPLILRNHASIGTNITHSLNNHCFTSGTGSQSNFLHILGKRTSFANAIKNTSTGCLRSSPNTLLIYRFSRYTTCCIQFVPFEGSVGIINPGHFSWACAVIWCRNVNCRSNKISLN